MCVCVCVCVCRVCVAVHVCVCLCACLYAYVLCMCVCVCLSVCLYTYVYMCMCVCVFLCACVCVCPVLAAASVVADYIDSEHHKVIFSLEEGMSVLKDVSFYSLESFDISSFSWNVSCFQIATYLRTPTQLWYFQVKVQTSCVKATFTFIKLPPYKLVRIAKTSAGSLSL